MLYKPFIKLLFIVKYVIVKRQITEFNYNFTSY